MRNNSTVRLSELKLPEDLKKLTVPQCKALCREIRSILINTVSENGGHLASNLGTVELTMAIHRVFDSPKDKIIWDVGHQAYTHKLLTGRLDRFSTLRTESGISGFAKPAESEHDSFISGHSSNSISAACGIAKAMRLNGDDHNVIAVIGDGAFTGGMAYEGLNNAGKSDDNLIVILNDNEMSISKNVGAFAKYLSSIRGKKAYMDVKKNVAGVLDKTPIIGEPIKEVLLASKDTMRWLLYRSSGLVSGPTMFENLGFVYLGPVDGHDLESLEENLRAAKAAKKPVLIHVNTVKGKGYTPAENNPGAFHGVAPNAIKSGNPEIISSDSFSAVFGKELAKLAQSNRKICAITAAMKYGTGLNFFAEKFPDRFFDVGIAEQHAVTFAAGLASRGLKPFFVVYSSFLQRGFDQIIHDIAIGGFPVRLLIDRAGIVGEDGETHQGLFDVSFLASVPDMTVYSPCYYSELENDIKRAAKEDRFCAVRYPRGCEKQEPDLDFSGDFTVINGGKKAIVTYGRLFSDALEAKAVCKDISIVKLNKIYPLSRELTDRLKEFNEIHFFEEGIRSGGIAELCAARLLEEGYGGIYKIHAVENRFVPTAAVTGAIKACGLDTESMIAAVSEK